MILLPDPALRLFLSVDIVGSTAFKLSQEPRSNDTVSTVSPSDECALEEQRSDEGHEDPSDSELHPWFSILRDFYHEFATCFTERQQARLDLAKQVPGWVCPADMTDLPPMLWKSLGDQLVFSAFIKRSLQIPWLVLSFRDAVLDYQNRIREISRDLDLKATAWLAGFPINNLAFFSIHNPRPPIDRPRDPAPNSELIPAYNAKHLDFAGRDIDLGFRLCQHSTPRKMFVSVDLAYALKKLTLRNAVFPTVTNDIRFCFEGVTPLKGVMRNRPYPLLWLHVQERPEDQIERSSVNNEIITFCESYYEYHNDLVFRPFVYQDPEHDSNRRLGEPPPGYEDRLEKMKDWIENQNAQTSEKNPETQATESNDASARLKELETQLGKLEQWRLRTKARRKKARVKKSRLARKRK